MSQINTTSRRGETLLEVVFAFVIFSLVTVISITVMNSGLRSAEAALELSLARTEIDSQAETLRYIQASYANDHGYRALWQAITLDNSSSADSLVHSSAADLPSLDATSCSPLYDQNPANGDKTVYSAHAFALNTRKVVSGTDDTQDDYYKHTLILAADDADKSDSTRVFRTSSLNPRVVYTDGDSDTDTGLLEENEGTAPVFNEVLRVEGLYDFVVKDTSHNKPNYYDFYIYTCWLPPGVSRATNIGTVVRLYNPGFLDE